MPETLSVERLLYLLRHHPKSVEECQSAINILNAVPCRAYPQYYSRILNRVEELYLIKKRKLRLQGLPTTGSSYLDDQINASARKATPRRLW